MLVLLYGNGWIGSQFIKLLDHEHIHYVVGKSRVDDDVIHEIKEVNPTHVISFIGRTH